MLKKPFFIVRDMRQRLCLVVFWKLGCQRGRSHSGGVWEMADSIKNLNSNTTRKGTYNADLTKKIAK